MHIQRHLSSELLRRLRQSSGPRRQGHVADNLNVGNDRAVLLSVITQLLPFIGYPRSLNALAAVTK
jgi:alkylhydroperoxidase/carboxymuconolactone decarboxylase family protein YurZ